MNRTIIAVIIGGAVTNYLIRIMPVILSTGRKMPEFLKSFLNILPIAALGALIFPGVIESAGENPLAGIAGVTSAALVSYFAGGLILPVVSAIGTAWLVIQFF